MTFKEKRARMRMSLGVFAREREKLNLIENKSSNLQKLP